MTKQYGPAANKEIVQAGFNYLWNIFMKYAVENDLGFVDVFMIAHNFHLHVVLDIEQQKGMSAKDVIILRDMAKATFIEALEVRPEGGHRFEDERQNPLGGVE